MKCIGFKNWNTKKNLFIYLLLFHLLYWQNVFSEYIIEEPVGKIGKDIPSADPRGWATKAQGVFLANQAYFKNWASGGVSSFSGTLFGRVITTKESKLSLMQGRFRLKYGLSYQKNASSSLQKTEDMINANLIYGLKLNREYYYVVARFGIQTQLTKGYNYDNNSKTLISSLLSPGYLNTGFGILYRKNNLYLSLYPMNNKNTVVANKTVKKSKYGLKDKNGFLSQTGFATLLNYEAPIMEHIYVQTVLDLFFDYKQFSNLDINLEVFIDMKINKLLSAKIITGLVYDNDIITNDNNNRLQFKSLFGLGISYKIDNHDVSLHFE